MNKLTEKQRQWLWFAILWSSGLAAALLLAHVIRWAMGMA